MELILKLKFNDAKIFDLKIQTKRQKLNVFISTFFILHFLGN